MPENRATERPHDLVLFGATGFTGRLTARYLAANAPADCRVALAGRNRDKLAAVRAELAGIRPAWAELPLLDADVTDTPALHRLAAATRVLLTTVGPYLRHGEELVAACAEAGTDYADLTGEPEFIDRTYVRHHETARRTGARLVHACGFDSVPHDLGVQYTVGLLPEGVPLRIDGYVTADARFSGGTLASALDAFSRGPQMLQAARERRRVEPWPTDRRVSTPTGGIRRVPLLRSWAVPLPTVDPQVVARSAAALDRYGPDFRYRHAAAVRRLPVALGGLAGTAGLVALAQLPGARRALTSRLGSGEGPSEERRARSTFSVRFLAEALTDLGPRRIATEVSGGDPGYDETAKMLAESALCLAHDELPALTGQLTTATAMGPALTDRLVRAGLRFHVTHEGR
ncbi:saccharopine dehydrogenase NADP-binding domain-containing protein [Streptomyces sp. DSM 42041]|uniref:Saccharopine dehydrogenase NADP-binding domain-containing protein n=1 Tax=Streptomyces hazeniae TaxID=3075538 RepID=A0ABU2NN21_9ACTN|nr:saccharopine dehydrogenase NADP-binding domain-containing protein [Streptomyces sp. DSM 42041]MDT0378160.1 saccharopine dehydrogenase NADP-binding domain-containing protein [Streptomyces sp. DSM 42041]